MTLGNYVCIAYVIYLLSKCSIHIINTLHIKNGEIVVNELNASIYEKRNGLSCICYSFCALASHTERIANGESTTSNNENTHSIEINWWKFISLICGWRRSDWNRIKLQSILLYFSLLFGKAKSLEQVTFELHYTRKCWIK